VLHEGRVVASLGLFGRDGFGRFQHVETHPDFRRRGLCRALVHAACAHGLHTRGWHTLVMAADPHDVAIALYRSVGFVQVETLWLLERRRRKTADVSERASPAAGAGLALALTGAILFSAKAIIVKLAYRHGVDAVTLIMYRMLFALPLFLALAWWAGPRHGPP
jgi:ribosomal protein S18 acetylase RimI-like enzyme